MAGQSVTGIRRIINAAGYSWLGFRAAFRHEAAFRQELLLLLIGAPLALYLTADGVERALMIGSLMLVLMVELLNSAVEAAIDRFGDEIHPLSGRAKDIASAAVFVSLANATMIWLLLLV